MVELHSSYDTGLDMKLVKYSLAGSWNHPRFSYFRCLHDFSVTLVAGWLAPMPIASANPHKSHYGAMAVANLKICYGSFVFVG